MIIKEKDPISKNKQEMQSEKAKMFEKFYILNLSDIIEVDINKSILAFAELGKISGVTRYDCGGMISWAIGVMPAVKAALRYYQSTINSYKLGKVTTEYFIKNCLNQVFRCPPQYSQIEWDEKLITAWNAMISFNEEKLEDFIKFTREHLEVGFILITNSNDLQIHYITETIQANFSLSLVPVSPEGLVFESSNQEDVSNESQQLGKDFFGEDSSAASNKNVYLISSHTAGTFKTDNMIMRILQKTGVKSTEVYTKYEGDISYCVDAGVQSTQIDNDFNYREFSRQEGKLKKA